MNRRRLTQALEPLMFAATIATAPAADESVMVLCEALDDGEFQHGPCYGWPQRSDGREPQRDDPCTFYEDSDGGLWVANWRPKEA
jgi:hypothetical protein